VPALTPHESDRPSPTALLAAGCGTAIASVCALGLVQIQRTLSGAWAVAAVATAGGLCLVLARAFSRLTHVVPSGAGLPAFLSRAYGRRVGLRLALPYLLLMIALAGVETRIVGVLLAGALGVPAGCGAAAFLLAGWAVCRRGIRPSYRVQIVATAVLMVLLGVLAAVSLVRAPAGALTAAAAPSPAAFMAGVGQAFFLFMGFELLTSHVEVAGSPRPIGRALRHTVWILIFFYALLAAGFAVAPAGPERADWLTPQVGLAEAAGGAPAAAAVIVACLLASYTSLAGALLALSRLVQVLAGQGVLPRPLARVDPRRLVPTRALDALTLAGAGAAAAIDGRAATLAVLGAAAAAATLVYAGVLLARERPPFREEGRPRAARLAAAALAAVLLLLGAGALWEALPPPPRMLEVVHAR
jgi:amino acid transporter